MADDVQQAVRSQRFRPRRRRRRCDRGAQERARGLVKQDVVRPVARDENVAGGVERQARGGRQTAAPLGGQRQNRPRELAGIAFASNTAGTFVPASLLEMNRSPLGPKSITPGPSKPFDPVKGVVI